MLRPRHLALASVIALAAALHLVPGTAEAADPVVCSVAVTSGAASNTALPTTGAVPCSWTKNSVILMQCDVSVYIDSTGMLALPDGGNQNPTSSIATSADQRVDFSPNSDPYPIYLTSADQSVSLLAVSTSGTCKFMKTLRARPY